MDIALPQSLFTVSDLSSLAGLVVAVYVIMSFLKEPLKSLARGDWIVRPFTVVIALGILLWLIFIQGSVTQEAIGLAVINSFLVAIIAGAAHDYIVAPTKSKSETQAYTNFFKQIIQNANIDTPEYFEVEVAAAQKTGDREESREEEPPKNI